MCNNMYIYMYTLLKSPIDLEPRLIRLVHRLTLRETSDPSHHHRTHPVHHIKTLSRQIISTKVR